MKNIITKIISIIMALVIPIVSFSSINIVYAMDDTKHLMNDTIEILYQSKQGEKPYIEIVETNGITYFYREDLNSIQSFSLGTNNILTEAYHKDTNSLDSMIRYEISTENNVLDKKDQEYINLLKKDSIELLNKSESLSRAAENIFNNIFNNIKELESDTIIIDYNLENDNQGLFKNEAKDNFIEPLGSNAAIGKAMDVYGPYVFNEYLTQGNYYNRTGSLYFSRTYGSYKTMSIFAKLGLSLTALSVLLGIPYSGVKAIISLIAGVGGTLVSDMAENVDYYKTTIYHAKEVKVGSIYPYRSLQDRIGEVLITSFGSSRFYYKKTKTTDNIYLDNQEIIKKGCLLY